MNSQVDRHALVVRAPLGQQRNHLLQPVAHDEAQATWYFGLRSDQRQGLSSLAAPDFALPDMTGKMHSLSDFRGKKVFLVTWASW